MDNQAWLNKATHRLHNCGIGTARLDALVLLEYTTRKDRSWLLAHPEFELTNVQVKNLNNFITRRSTHEPISYIIGRTEFYGREFTINKHVLEPRPESEALIDLLKYIWLSDYTIIDVGTGSGALAITAKLELPSANVIAVDIDEACLKVAQRNAKKHSMSITFAQSDLLSFLPSQPVKNTILLCNLPYVPDSFTINPAAMNEPKIAIFGGPDGLDVYWKLFEQINILHYKPLYILTEAMPPQHTKLSKIANASNYNLTRTDDFIQLFELCHR